MHSNNYTNMSRQLDRELFGSTVPRGRSRNAAEVVVTMPNLKETLRSVFGLEDFRPMQEEICQAVIQSMSQLMPRLGSSGLS
jgi:hypothetical protein